MGIIRNLTPLNLLEEKEKFFNNFSYNPQFKYSKKFSLKDLNKWGFPKHNFVNHAKKMIILHGPYINSSIKNITEDEIKKKCNKLFSKLKIKEIPVFFSPEYISRVMIDKNGIYFRLPIEFDSEQLKNILNHEIQTHLLLRFNEKKQAWFGKIKKNISFKKTEEGLANLHSYIDAKNKIMKRSYAGYFTTYLAQKYSFSQVFSELLKFGLNPKLAWSLTVRRKRGITDTSKVGGFTKDIIYLEGAVDVWRWLQNHKNNPKDLYLGRLSIEAIEKERDNANRNELIYPTFFKNISEYLLKINEIGEINQFKQL